MSDQSVTGERDRQKRPEPKRPEPKRPYHVGIAIGITSGVYAICLLGTTRLQIEADRAIIADRAPTQTAIDLLDSNHDWLEARLEEARTRYADRLTGYDGLANRVATLDERLAAMDKTVVAIERLGASLSVNLSLPTGRSGSGQGSTSNAGGGSGKSSGGGSTQVKPPPPPPAAKPPPTSGTTGASGAP